MRIVLSLAQLSRGPDLRTARSEAI